MAFELLAQRSQNPVAFRNVFLDRLSAAIRSMSLATEAIIDGSLLTAVGRAVHVSHAEAGGRAVYVS